MKIKLELQGVDREIAKLKRVAASARKVIRRAVEKGATIQLQAEKRLAVRQRTGLLKKSLGKTVRTYPSGVVVSYTGPRKGFKTTIKEVQTTARRSVAIGERVQFKDGKRIAKTIKLKGAVKAGTRLDPSAYSHLVEKGHKRGKGKSSAKAYPFIAPAGEQTKSAVYAAVVTEISQKLGTDSE